MTIVRARTGAWQMDSERRPVAYPGALDADGSAVSFHERLDQRESDAQSRKARARRLFALAKEIENPGNHTLGNPDAIVADFDDDQSVDVLDR